MNVSYVVDVCETVSFGFIGDLSGSAHLVACHTLQAIPILSLEQIDNETVIPSPVYLPFFLRSDVRRKRLELGLAFGRKFHRGRFDLYPIQILVQPIEHKREEFLRIMLIRSRKLVCKDRDTLFERDGGKKRVVFFPHCFEELRKGVGESAFHAEGVLQVDGALVAAV